MIMDEKKNIIFLLTFSQILTIKLQSIVFLTNSYNNSSQEVSTMKFIQIK